MKIQYTLSERTEMKYTVGQAISAAELVLKERKGRRLGLCMNAVGHRSYHDTITLEELNKISERIVSDSIYYGV